MSHVTTDNGVKSRIHLSVSPSLATPSRLIALAWTALWAKENRLNSLLNPIHQLSVHQSGPLPSHGELEVRTWDSRSCSPIYFCIDKTSQANLSWLGTLRLGLVHRYIPGLTSKCDLYNVRLPSGSVLLCYENCTFSDSVLLNFSVIVY